MSVHISTTNKQAAQEGKSLAIIAHFFVIGIFVSWILNLQKNNPFVSFYNRQIIGWHLLMFLNGGLIHFFFGGFVKFIIWGILIFLWITSLFGAMKEKKVILPFFGTYFQKIFKSL